MRGKNILIFIFSYYLLFPLNIQYLNSNRGITAYKGIAVIKIKNSHSQKNYVTENYKKLLKYLNLTESKNIIIRKKIFSDFFRIKLKCKNVYKENINNE